MDTMCVSYGGIKPNGKINAKYVSCHLILASIDHFIGEQKFSLALK